MSLFDQLSNETLKRVFKYVLKKTIGQYLIEKEILLDQIYVHSRDGIVKIFSLNVDCDYINTEFLQNSGSFRVKSFTIESLEAKISYSSLISDGFKLYIKGVNIVLEPQSSIPQNVNTLPSNNETVPKVTNDNNKIIPTNQSTTNYTQPAMDKTNEGQQGLHFVAGWVELLIASLQVITENIQIVIQGTENKDDQIHGPCLVIFLTKFIFSNTHPSELPSETSTNLAASLAKSRTQSKSFQPNNSTAASYLQTIGNTKVNFFLLHFFKT